MRLLLDEHISPALVTRLAEVGVYAQSVPHVGLAGRADHEIWQYALDHDFAVVATNARDFIELLDVDVRLAREWPEPQRTMGPPPACHRAREGFR